jgi:hypothetical protein
LDHGEGRTRRVDGAFDRPVATTLPPKANWPFHRNGQLSPLLGGRLRLSADKSSTYEDCTDSGAEQHESHTTLGHGFTVGVEKVNM